MDRGLLETMGFGLVSAFLACCVGLVCCSCGGATFESGTPETDAGSIETDAGHERMQPEAATDAPAESAAACVCGDASCWYSKAKVVALSPGRPSARFIAAIASSSYPNHDAVWFDLDVSAFPNGGSLIVAGQMGPTGTDGTAYLFPECDSDPLSPGGNYSPVEDIANVPPGMAWTFPTYAFAAGTTVLHLGTEGSWYNANLCPNCTAGATNTNTITVTVQ